MLSRVDSVAPVLRAVMLDRIKRLIASSTVALYNKYAGITVATDPLGRILHDLESSAYTVFSNFARFLDKFRVENALQALEWSTPGILLYAVLVGATPTRLPMRPSQRKLLLRDSALR